MSNNRKYDGLTPEDIVEGLRVLIASEGPALKVRPIGGNMGGGGGEGSGTMNYPSLLNKPKINGVELVGNKSWKDLGLDLSGGGSGGDIPDKLPNPYALTIVDGEDTTVYDGSSAKTLTLPQIPEIPEVPDKLPNPKSLTVKLNGVATIYDGSVAKEITIPDRSASIGKLTISQSEKQDIEYDGSEDVSVHLPSASVIAEKDVLLEGANMTVADQIFSLSAPYTDYEYLVFTSKIGNDQQVGLTDSRWVRTSDIAINANISLAIVWANGNYGFQIKFVTETQFSVVNKFENTDNYSDLDVIGINFVQPPMNPFPLIITQGDEVHEYTGHETVNVTVPDTSAGIKNPNALVIHEAGKADVSYDGSMPKEITIPQIPDIPDPPQIPDRLPNPYALTVNYPDGSSKTYDGSAAKAIDIPNPSVDNEPLTLNFDGTSVVYDGKSSKTFDVQIPGGNIMLKSEDVILNEQKFVPGNMVSFNKPISNYDYIVIKWLMESIALDDNIYGYPKFQVIKVSDMPISETKLNINDPHFIAKTVNSVHSLAIVPEGATHSAHQERIFGLVGTSYDNAKLDMVSCRNVGAGVLNWYPPKFKIYGYKFVKKDEGEAFGKTLTIVDGDQTYTYNGSQDKTITIHAPQIIPDELPNPYPLTFKGLLEPNKTYDGSEAVTVQFPYGEVSDKTTGAPVGNIIAYMGNDAPTNYLKCDGSVYNIIQYPELADHFQTQFGSKNYFGGNGTTTFAVPDLRGEFLRGTGTAARSTGTGADVGMHQDATEYPNIKTGRSAPVYAGNPLNDGNITEATNIDSGRNLAASKNEYVAYIANTSSGSDSGSMNYTYYTGRPTNTSVMYCIKYQSTFAANYQMDSYSTEEHVCGKWIDGRTLYERTIDGGVLDIIASSATSPINKDIVIPGLSTIDKTTLFIHDILIHASLLREGITKYANFSSNISGQTGIFYQFIRFETSSIRIVWLSPQWKALKGYFTIRYCKN